MQQKPVSAVAFATQEMHSSLTYLYLLHWASVSPVQPLLQTRTLVQAETCSE
jgi:hypothetical protein